ncbi:MAG TPA: hypothetical protein VEF04_19875 [Blastocatellia bacterium]|nr:hypothetical protein [Blastocatellia bacterium]
MPEKDRAQGENIRRLITLLWFLINITMVGFVLTSFFTGGRAPLAICIAAPVPNTTSPTMQPTLQPTLAPNSNFTQPPTTFTPTAAPTNASDDDDDDGLLFYDDGNQGFVVMWSTLLLVALSIGGTMVLKSHRTPFAVGAFAGVVLLMANVMFMLSASAAGELRRRALLGISTSADQAILAFAVLEFLFLCAFSLVLFRHKDEILEIRP